jgi:hypothetical protein
VIGPLLTGWKVLRTHSDWPGGATFRVLILDDSAETYKMAIRPYQADNDSITEELYVAHSNDDLTTPRRCRSPAARIYRADQ